MTGTELINIIKSPTAKILGLGTIIIVGALVLIPMLSRDDDRSAITKNAELRQEEKAPIDINSPVQRIKIIQTANSEETLIPIPGAENPPVINQTGKKPLPISNTATVNSPAERATGANDRPLPERTLSGLLGGSENAGGKATATASTAPANIFIMSAVQGGKEAEEKKAFLSERYAPFGRLLDCKLVNTLESNVNGTPLIAMVIEDLWWTNANGERKLIIPAGTEVHGKMGSCVRNRMMCEGNFILVWQITSDQVGMELQLQGRILEKSNQAGNKNKATITDMAAGIPGRVMGNGSLDEMLQYTMAFAQGLSAGFQSTTTFDNGNTIVQKSDGSAKNALASAFESMSNVALENITDKIAKESYYIRVAAGTEFYLYIEQVTNVEKAAIADTALNNLEASKLSQIQKSQTDPDVERASILHEALGQAIPKSLQKELKGIR